MPLSGHLEMSSSSDYWDVLAPHHLSIENNFLDLPSMRLIEADIRQPVLVVGAGLGLIVEGLRRKGFRADGVDLSAEMVRYAKLRRGITVVRADARALPFGELAYETVIYATGVIDFMRDEEQIALILDEARRVAGRSGKIFVAFYRFSAASEGFLTRLGLLSDNVLSYRETIEVYRLNPFQAISWVAKRAETGYLRASILSLSSLALSTNTERGAAFAMQRLCRDTDHAESMIKAAPERQPYRNEPEIRDMFGRLAIPIKKLHTSRTCYIVQI